MERLFRARNHVRVPVLPGSEEREKQKKARGLLLGYSKKVKACCDASTRQSVNFRIGSEGRVESRAHFCRSARPCIQTSIADHHLQHPRLPSTSNLGSTRPCRLDNNRTASIHASALTSSVASASHPCPSAWCIPNPLLGTRTRYSTVPPPPPFQGRPPVLFPCISPVRATDTVGVGSRPDARIRPRSRCRRVGSVLASTAPTSLRQRLSSVILRISLSASPAFALRRHLGSSA